MSNDALLAALARPTFDAGFVNWLATADMEEIEGAYAENYKDAHGIKARWVYGAGHTREEFADMFVHLGYDLKREEERQDAEDAAFVKRVADLGLTEWAARNGIKTELDLMEYNYRQEWQAEDA
jgi:hypothetical protein